MMMGSSGHAVFHLTNQIKPLGFGAHLQVGNNHIRHGLADGGDGRLGVFGFGHLKLLSA
jgi:hypothetical protein